MLCYRCAMFRCAVAVPLDCLTFFFLLCLLFHPLNTRHAVAAGCQPDQAAALLQMKLAFSSSVLHSWRAGTDCCAWEGVLCDAAHGRVTKLELSGLDITGYLHPALFNLTSLRHLNLAYNQFSGSLPSPGFEHLRELRYLNLSACGFTGQVPIGISHLTRLVSLDLSTWNPHELSIQDPSFQVLVSNLSNLRELHLDFIDMSNASGLWCHALATSTPRLQVLSMFGCSLSGSIDSSLLRLRSLTHVSLGLNMLSSVVPDFSKSLSNLSFLHLEENGLKGLFPPGIFQLRSLETIILSINCGLTVLLPDFPKDSSLVVMDITGTNFISIPSSIGNLKNLTALVLDGLGDLPDSIGSLESLTSLFLYDCRFSRPIPSSIGNLKSLTRLRLTGCSFPGAIPDSIGNLSSLIELQLSGCVTAEQLPASITNLNSLQMLDLSNCNISGQIPQFIGNLSSLQDLGLGQNSISGPIPPSVSTLSSLQYLDLFDCNISGSIPPSFANLTQLRTLYLQSNSLTGMIPSNVQWPLIHILYLYDNYLTGPIPYSFRNCTFLMSLYLMNNSLSGSVPPILFTFPALQELNLASNLFSGPIQNFSKPSPSLDFIDLSRNELSGPIPTSFSGLTTLQELRLQSNIFDGTTELLPFLRLPKLSVLDLSDNRLSVIQRDNSSLRDNSSFPLGPIEELGLASCNLTVLPIALRYLRNIESLDLSSNQISGSIPKWFWENLNSMSYLNLSHNRFESIEGSPYVLPTLASDFTLDLSSNAITGPLPIPLGSSVFLDYSRNEFTSILPNFTLYIKSTAFFMASRNKLTGIIPSTICSVASLVALDLSYNNLSSQIPSCILDSSLDLVILNLEGNNFHGMLPRKTRKGCSLRTIKLSNNSFEGQLPRSLIHCKDLEVLDLGYNHIYDSFPSWLGKLPKLQVLVLRSNKFHGSIEYSIADHNSSTLYFPSLKIIDLASNNLSGTLHRQWFHRLESFMALDGSGDIIQYADQGVTYYHDSITVSLKGQVLTFTKILTAFTIMDFSSNGLSGNIPDTVAELIALHGLNLAHNAFKGHIPSQLGVLSQLESLDLSFNQLTGEIPEELANLTSLEWLDLSYNNLSGGIPQGGQLTTFPESAFKGNVELCGLPLPEECPGRNNSETPDATSLSRLDSEDIILFVFTGSGFGIGFAVVILVQLFVKKVEKGLHKFCGTTIKMYKNSCFNVGQM